MAVNVQWNSMRDYDRYHHVLGAAPCFVHPMNGNIYYWACEQKNGTRQNLTIYREMGSTLEWQEVVTFEGAIDAQSFIERGGAQIGQGGALVVATSLIPKGVEYVTTTGFQGMRCRIPGVDEPWNFLDLYSRLDRIEAHLKQLDQQVGALMMGSGDVVAVLSAEERKLLDYAMGMIHPLVDNQSSE